MKKKKPPPRGGAPRRHNGAGTRKQASRRTEVRKPLEIHAGADLPNWIKDEITRVTKKERRDEALAALADAAEAFAAAKYRRAVSLAERAKQAAPNSATVRELLGLAAYRGGDWDRALKELRAFRRIAGDTSHMPIEMDALRALDRPADVEKAWALFQELGGSPDARKEGRVVYGSFLLDTGNPQKAWAVTKPGRVGKDATEADLRQWYVAARAASHLGDNEAAGRLLRAIIAADAAFPGLEQLEREIAG